MGVIDSLRNLFKKEEKEVRKPVNYKEVLNLTPEEEQELDNRLYEACMQGKKYILYREEETEVGKLWRIMACKDMVVELPNLKNRTIHVGDFGGLIKSEENLPQKYRCWIDYDVMVYDNAVISEYAYAEGHVCVFDSAVVDGDVRLIGAFKLEKSKPSRNTVQIAGNNSVQVSVGNVVIVNGVVVKGGQTGDELPLRVCGNAHVGKCAVLRDHVLVSEEAKVDCHALMEGHATASGNALVDGYAKMRENASIQDKAVISNAAEASGNAVIKGESCMLEESFIGDNAVISDEAKAYGKTVIRDNAHLSEEAVIAGCVMLRGNAVMSGEAEAEGNSFIAENAVITDKAHIAEDASIGGNAVVKENAYVAGDSVIKGNVVLKGMTRIRNRNLSGNECLWH